MVLALPLLLVASVGSLSLALLGLGIAIAPSMITTFTLAERTTPVRRLGAAMTALAASTGAGYALGAALAGRFADLGGHLPAFAVTVAATALAAGLAWAGAGVVRSQAQTPAPAPGTELAPTAQ